ncbi:MAG: carbohydrate ABC transporter permease [Bacillota bacterium]
MEKKAFYFKDRYWLYVFLAPSVVALLLLTVFPLIYSLRNTFYGWDLIVPGSENKYVGLKNYIDVLSSPVFLASLKTTAVYAFFSIVGTVLVGTLLAFVLFRNLFGGFVLRTIAIAAMVISPAIIGTVFKLMLNPTWGVITWILSLFSIRNEGLLANVSTVLPTLIAVEVWEWSPLVMVIILAGLQGLPVDVFESATVDGAGAIKKFFFITLPMLKSSFLLAILLRTIDSMRAFDLIFNMTQGGPGTASQTTNLLMYNTGFQFFQISKASTMAIVLLIIITILSSIIIKIFRGGELLQ